MINKVFWNSHVVGRSTGTSLWSTTDRGLYLCQCSRVSISSQLLTKTKKYGAVKLLRSTQIILYILATSGPQAQFSQHGSEHRPILRLLSSSQHTQPTYRVALQFSVWKWLWISVWLVNPSLTDPGSVARCALQKPEGSTSKSKCFSIVYTTLQCRWYSFRHT